MKRPRISLATIGFVIFVLAIDFGLLRWGLGSDSLERELSIYFFPMLDVLLVAVYRSARRWSRPSPSRTGFLISGSLATLLFIGAIIAAPEVVIRALGAVEEPVFRSTLNFLTRTFGNGIMQSRPVRLLLGISFELLGPLLFCNLPPLFVALGCRWLVRRRKSRWGSVATPGIRPAFRAS